MIFKIVKYVLIDILRNRIVLGYTICLFLISFAIFSLEDNATKGLLSLLNIILFIVPLVSMLFATIYMYNSAEFIELLVSQPLRRKHIWLSLFAGLSISMALAFFLGVGIPIFIFQSNATGFMMLGTGLILSLIFVALAMLASALSRDKAKGIGMVTLIWLYFSILFDAGVLFLLFQFADYPLETPMVVLTAFNPMDIGRILILLKMDVSALMGYTGAIFKDYFGTIPGLAISFFVLVIWVLLPTWLSLKIFKRKDL